MPGFVIGVPSVGSRFLRIVDAYKHVGSEEMPNTMDKDRAAFSEREANPTPVRMQDVISAQAGLVPSKTTSKRSHEESVALEEGSIFDLASLQPPLSRRRSRSFSGAETLSNSLSWTRSGSSLSDGT